MVNVRIFLGNVNITNIVATLPIEDGNVTLMLEKTNTLVFHSHGRNLCQEERQPDNKRRTASAGEEGVVIASSLLK